MIERVNLQIINAARISAQGRFHWSFINSYSFRDYFYVFGDGVVRGDFSGRVRLENGIMVIEGEIVYQYSDEFTDPLDIREGELGSSSLKPASAQWTEIGGTPFPIGGSWATEFKSEAKLDASDSIYYGED